MMKQFGSVVLVWSLVSASLPVSGRAWADDADEVPGGNTATEETTDDSAGVQADEQPSVQETVAEEPRRAGNADVWTLVGIAGASAGGSVAYFLASANSQQDLDALEGELLFTRNERIRLNDKAQAEQNLGIILAGVSVAATIGATVLGIHRGRDGEEVTLTPVAAPGLVSLQLSGRF
jgi:hypothetical protein